MTTRLLSSSLVVKLGVLLLVTLEAKEGAGGALHSALISSSLNLVRASFCFALVTDPVNVIVVVVSSTKDDNVAADDVALLRTLPVLAKGEMTGSTTGSVFGPSGALPMIIPVDFRFGTLPLPPNLLLFFLVLALVLLRSRKVPEEEIVEDDDRLFRRTGSFARRADGNRGAADEEECLFETPIDGIVARGASFNRVLLCSESSTSSP